jgi:serine/threonine protein kinase
MILPVTRFKEAEAFETSEEALSTRLLREPRLHLRATGELAVQVAERLTELHAVGAIHGELSPGNVALAIADDPERISVVGLSHVVTPRGAPVFPDPEIGYGSPETLLGFTPDRRVDCWAFAVLLYRCAYGRLPFRARTSEELLSAVSRPLVVPEAFGPDTDALLVGFFERCFAHRSAVRLSCARAIGATFGALVSEAERISPDPFSFRPQRPHGVIVPISAAGRPRV